MTYVANTINTKNHSDAHQKDIKSGWVIDISEQAKEAGYSVPVVISTGAWNKYILTGLNSHPHAEQLKYQKLKMILISLTINIKKSHRRAVINFKLFSMPEYGIFIKTKFAFLKARISLNYNSERVVIIMLPREEINIL